MATQPIQQDPAPELQEAFRRHLPRRLRTLLRRARTQCRTGWDCNVLRSLHDEIALLAGACGRYGMLETGERLLALESALAAPVAAHRVPDGTASAGIDALLDSLRPHVEQPLPGAGVPAWLQGGAALAGSAPFPRCEVPPDRYWVQLGITAVHGAAVAAPGANDAAAVPAEGAAAADAPQGPRVCVLNDDDALVNELLLRLEQQGCEVSLKPTLEGLLEQLRRDPPELAVVVADAATPLDRLARALREARADPARRARLLVLLRKPDVELQLRALRTGADRCVALPAPPEEVVGAAVELASVNEESAYRIMIVDDDAPQALFAQAILRRAGMETRVLNESLTVLEELDRFHPDLLLLDLNMPDCDGFELTALIRERDGYVNTPIVFLSGDEDEERQFAALDAGADDFLTKPIRPAHLVAAVTNRVRRARMAASRVRRKRRRDAGTGLHERAQLLDALADHLSAGVGGTATGGLLGIDVLAAQALRDQLGLAPFDQLLAQVGTFIAGRVPGGCMTSRHGACGYLVFAPALDERALTALADEILGAAREARFGARASAVELACAACALDAGTPESALALAAVERTLEAARAAPGRIAVHSQLAADPEALAARIGAALAAQAFRLAFQPVIPIRGAAEPQYQALLRLSVDGREYVARELVPVAARAGTLGDVDAWVLGRCVDILTERMREGDPVRLFASQSLPAWRGAARLQRLQSSLDAHGVQPGSLVVEFRAEDVQEHADALAELAPGLARMGVTLAIAGVGPDAVAASWMEHAAPGYVKLAPGLDDAAMADVVRAAHARGARIIAARVETLAQVERVRAAGAELLQGNYFRPPSAELGDAFPQVEA